MRWLGRRRLSFALAWSAFAVLAVAAYGTAGHVDRPLSVTTPPAVIPSRGIRFEGATLLPAPASASRMTHAQALALGRKKYGLTGNVRAVLASLTDPSTFNRPKNDPFGGPIRKKPAWILTKTYAKPVVLPGFTVQYAKYDTVAIDAVTGKFLIGYRY